MDRNADTVLFKLKQHTKKVIVYEPCGELSRLVKEGYNRTCHERNQAAFTTSHATYYNIPYY